MCPVMSLRHAALGLLIAGFLLEAAVAGGRFAPEPLNFVADLIALAASGATYAPMRYPLLNHTLTNKFWFGLLKT